MHVLFDVDPGHDDAIGLMTALAHPETFTVLGVTTVAGNQNVGLVTDNVLKLLDYLGFSVPVAMGAEKPLRRAPEPQPGAHGVTGMDGPVLPAATSRPVSEVAAPFLYRRIMESPEPVTIIALAPMTNLALLLLTHPDVKKRIAKICFMGGSIYTGSMLARSEFNIYHDPEAARIVFRSGIPLVMSGLEICYAARTRFDEFAPLQNGGKAAKLAYELFDFFAGYSKSLGSDYAPIFDAVPVIQLLEPEIFTHALYNVDVETEGELCRGMTVADFRKKPCIENAVTVLENVDRERFQTILIDSIRSLDCK